MRFAVQALLFDIDGTLVDSTSAVERSWRSWAVARGLDAEEILLVCHGRRTEDTVGDLLPAEQREAAVAELARLELSDLDEVVALPGAREILDRLPADRWAAVTSGSRELMTARLAAAGLPTPRVLVAAEDVLEGKPHPQGYLAAAASLGQDIGRCLVIEDAPAGVRAGRAAGAHVLAVLTSHSASELEEADAVVTDLRQCSVESTAEGITVVAGHASESGAGASLTRAPLP